MESSSVDIPLVQVRTYRKRYLMVFITYAAFFITWYQVSQYIALTTTIAAYYHVSDVDVTLTAAVFTLVYATLAYPFSFIMEAIGIKNSFVLGTFCTSVGACIKCFSVEPQHFWTIVIGQAVCAVGQVFIFGSGTAVAATWCDSKEVATVNALAYGVTCLSPAVNFLLQSLMFGKGSDTKMELAQLTSWVAVATTIVFLVTVIFMEERPPTPPSYAQLSRISQLTESNTRELLSSRNYLLITLAFGISQLVGNTLTACINVIISTILPGDCTTVSIVGILMTASGAIGAFAFGRMLDSTKRFKDMTIVSYVSTLLALSMFLFSFYNKSLTTLYISSALMGITFNAYGAIAIDTMIELTYPFPETRSAGLMVCISAALATPSPIICTKLFITIGVLHTVLILVCILILGLVLLFCVKWDLKRQAAEDEHRDVMIDPINDTVVDHDDEQNLVIT